MEVVVAVVYFYGLGLQRKFDAGIEMGYVRVLGLAFGYAATVDSAAWYFWVFIGWLVD